MEPTYPTDPRPARLGAAIVALCIPATPALADMACMFDTECYETEPCQGGDFGLEIVAGAPTVLSTGFGDLPLVMRTANGAWVAEGQGMTLMLTKAEGGAARASVHMMGAGMVNYTGTCDGEM